MNTFQIQEQDELLNINQAAEFLQVSPVSLRRWTDAGRLNCYRIGGRRERRFRRPDLEAFLGERDPATAETAASAAAVETGAVLGLQLAYGSHLCALYESDQGRLRMSVPFLAEGLRSRDVCYLVASTPVSSAIVAALDDAGINVDTELRQGQLRMSAGEESVTAIYDFFSHELLRASQSGRHLRVLGDMAWFLDRGMSLPDIVEFEQRYNHFLAHQYPLISLCQFDARRFDGMGIMNALKCHEDTFDYPVMRFIGN